MRLPKFLARRTHRFSTAAKTKFGDSPRILGEFLGQSPKSVALRDKNLCIIRAILSILFLGSLTFGQIFSPDETVSRIADNLMCTCGCPHIIGQCGDECSVAPQLVHEISELVSAGNTEEDVYKVFEDKYGLRVRAVPKAEGFNLLVWVMPFVGLLAGVVVIFFVINRLKPDDSNQETERVHPEIDEKYRKLIDRELER